MPETLHPVIRHCHKSIKRNTKCHFCIKRTKSSDACVFISSLAIPAAVCWYWGNLRMLCGCCLDLDQYREKFLFRCPLFNPVIMSVPFPLVTSSIPVQLMSIHHFISVLRNSISRSIFPTQRNEIQYWEAWKHLRHLCMLLYLSHREFKLNHRRMMTVWLQTYLSETWQRNIAEDNHVLWRDHFTACSSTHYPRPNCESCLRR
jgi:hypothetical protein